MWFKGFLRPKPTLALLVALLVFFGDLVTQCYLVAAGAV
jgi:hypothetical protein